MLLFIIVSSQAGSKLFYDLLRPEDRLSMVSQDDFQALDIDP